MGISMMVLFPLTFISNVFVDPETMPSWLQAFVEVNPVTLLVNAVRGCMEGDPSGSDIGIALALRGGDRRGLRPAHDAQVQPGALDHFTDRALEGGDVLDGDALGRVAITAADRVEHGALL